MRMWGRWSGLNTSKILQGNDQLQLQAHKMPQAVGYVPQQGTFAENFSNLTSYLIIQPRLYRSNLLLKSFLMYIELIVENN